MQGASLADLVDEVADVFNLADRCLLMAPQVPSPAGLPTWPRACRPCRQGALLLLLPPPAPFLPTLGWILPGMMWARPRWVILGHKDRQS